MNKAKRFVKDKLINFQLQIAEFTSKLKQQEDYSNSRESKLYLGLCEILDIFENIEEDRNNQINSHGESTIRLAKNMRVVKKKIMRLLKANAIVPMEMANNKARMDYCKVVDTKPIPDLEDQTILTIVKTGYLNKQQNKVLRKAEVITVLNNSGL